MKRMIFRIPVFITALWLGTAASCTHTPVSYTVRGTLPDSTLNGSTLYITHFDTNENLDSTVVAGDKFEFTGTAQGSVLSRIDAGKKLYANFILENGEILLDLENHRPRNSPLNNELNLLLEAGDSLEAAIDNYRENITVKTDSAEISADRAKKQLQEYYNLRWKPAYIAKMLDSYNRNKENDVAYLAFIKVHFYLDNARFDSLIKNAAPDFLEKPAVKSTVENRNALKKTSEGMMFTDFSIDTPDGGKIALSDYVGKGKYVLVDFWASWCGPCRAEIPVIARVYEKYKNKGLAVLGVAVWDEPNATVQAVTEEKIAWPQIINAGDIPTKLYGIQGIPHIILFGPDGTILARGLRGERLEEKVAQVMK